MHETNNNILSFLLNFLFKKADTIIVLSEVEKTILKKKYGALSFVIFPNAVNPLIKEFKNIHKDDNIKFIFFGRITKTKGIYTISKCFEYLTSYFDKFTFDIYGTGPDLNNWITALSKSKELKYYYKGVIGGEKKWEVLNSSDIFLLPSEFEGLPIAMLEAMAAGCTVIVSDVGSIKTVVTNNLNGIILSENSPKSLALIIEDILNYKIDTNLIGHNAQEHIYNNFSFLTYIKRLDNLYSTL